MSAFRFALDESQRPSSRSPCRGPFAENAICQQPQTMVQWPRCSDIFLEHFADMVPHNAKTGSEHLYPS